MLLMFRKLLVVASCFRYNEHVVWGDKDVKMKLLRKGILTRIYTPMVSDKFLEEKKEKQG